MAVRGTGAAAAPAPLGVVLPLTFFGSVAGGAFWAVTFFVAARVHAFSPLANLALAVAMGLVYAAGAWRAGALQRAVSPWLSPRGLCRAMLALVLAAAVLPLALRAPAGLVVASLAGCFAMSVLWPVVEAYVSGGRQGAGLRRAVGNFNTTWSAAVPLTLVLVPVLGARHIDWAYAVTAGTTLVALAFAGRLPRDLAPHDHAGAAVAQGDEYPALMRCAQALLPLSYVFSSMLAPLLPHRLAALGIGADRETLAAAIWMVARSLALFALSRVHVWHGRWPPLMLAACGLAVGLAGTLAAPWPLVALLSLALFGVSMALVYTAALYYTLAVGRAEVDAGGRFEGLIGVGYVLGPLLGVGGAALGGAGPTALLACALAGGVGSLAFRRRYGK